MSCSRLHGCLVENEDPFLRKRFLSSLFDPVFGVEEEPFIVEKSIVPVKSVVVTRLLF